MSHVDIRIDGAVGRITLNHPEALNALTHPMCLAIEAALDAWVGDDAVALVLIDAVGEKAFCAGGDIHQLYDAGRAGDSAEGASFWRDEYRLNRKLAEFPKPVVSLMQGFTMGGGVGIGCHGSHRVVCETSKIAMPEVSIGLVPDVGGSWILANAPGRIGEYLGLTAARIGPADAILAGFADTFVPQDAWPDLVKRLCEGVVSAVADAAQKPPEGRLATDGAWIDPAFAEADPHAMLTALETATSDGAAKAATALRKNSPLALACSVQMIRTLRDSGADMAEALATEFRFTSRAMEHGDFLEGIRAAIIDKDHAPNWRHSGLDAVSEAEVAAMLAPLGKNELWHEPVAKAG
ncbi:MAG: enoyl-CoA hydratase/isomerase family protein [Pseudomonadota bacterium]